MPSHALVSGIGRLGVAVLVAAAPLVPGRAAAQDTSQCRFLEGTANAATSVVPGAGRVSYVSRPRIACSDGVRIQADSAVAYSAQNMSHLIGHVRYRDGTREMRADDARYFSQVARLQAVGHLFVRDFDQGSTIENGELVYLRRTSFRSEEQMTVTRGRDRARPKALLHMRPGEDTVSVDSAQATPSEPDTVPYQVEADRLFLQGDRYFSAGGDVVIERDSLVAHSDSAEYDQVAALMTMLGSAHVEGSAYDLSGRTIEMAIESGQMRSVRALHEAQLVGDDLEMRAPSIHIFLVDGSMDRLVAIRLLPSDSAPPTPAGGAPPPPVDSVDLARPVAEAQDFTLTADSVEVRTPGQVLDRIFAAGKARGESTARDSLNVPSLPEVARRDWLEGDTVIANFVRADPPPGQPADTTRGDYRLERLTAQGGARSLYRLLPSDSTARPGIDAPAVHYVTGSVIVIVMNEGEVGSMEVEGPTTGWHLEPTTRGAPADSLARPDTTRIGPDTTWIGPDTTRVGPGSAVATSALPEHGGAFGHDSSRGGAPDDRSRRRGGLPARGALTTRADRRWRRR